MYPSPAKRYKTQIILTLPPMMALFGFGVYILRSYALTGYWRIHDANLARELGFGLFEDGVLVWTMLSLLAFVPWCCLQFYLIASDKQHVRLFWGGLMAYLMVGYAILADMFHLVPTYWD